MAQGRIKLGVDIVKGNTNGLNDLKKELASLNQSIDKLKLEVDTHSALGDLQEVQDAIKAVEKALSVSYNLKLDSTNITKFRESLKESNMTISQIQQAFKKAGVEGENAFRNLSVELLTSNKNLKETNKTLDKMAETLSNTVRWTIASTALNSVTGSIQKAWSFTKQLDTSLNDIRIVTGKSADEMARFAKQANTVAKNLGATTKNYTDAALIYYQQGLSEEDVQARASTTLKTANVTGQSSAEVSQQLTAVWNGYKVQAQEAELYVDKLSAVATETAADLEELSTGMSKVASAANVMGVDIDQLNAQLATIVSVTRQAPESIGTALKTVYARMTDIQSGLDMETTLGEYTSQMAEMGINILDSNGQLREMGEVVEEIGDNWTKLTREQQISLAQTIAGTRQYNNMMALFDNWDMYQSAKSTSENSAGSLQKQQEIYLDSLEAHLNKLTAEAEELYQTLMDPKGLNPLIDALTKIVGLIENAAEGLGGGKGVLRVAAGYGMNLMRGKVTSEIARGWQNSVSEKENRKMAQDEQAIAQEINIDNVNDERAKKLIQLKKSQLQVSRSLTAEEIKAQNAQIESTNELYKQQDALKAQKQMLEEMSQKHYGESIFGEDGLVKDDASFEEAYQAKIENLKKKHISMGSQDAITDLSFRRERVQNVLEGSSKKVEYAQNHYDVRIARGEGGDEEALKALMAAQHNKQQDEKHLERLNEELNEKLEQERSTIRENIADIKEYAAAEDLSVEQKEELKDILNELNTVYDRNGNLIDDNAESVERGRDAFRRFNKVLDEQEQELKEMRNAANGYNNELKKTTEATAQAEKELKKEQERLEKMSTVDIFSNMTTGIVNLGSAIENVKNLGSIWSNDDLTTGEKLLQTMINLAITLPMVFSGIKLVKAGLFDLLGKVAMYGAATKASTKATKDSAEASFVKKMAQDAETDSTKDASAANMEKSATEEILQQQVRETAQASREKTVSQNSEMGGGFNPSLSSGGPTQIPNGKIPKTNFGKWKTQLTQAKAGASKFLTAHAGPVAGIGGAIIAISATAALMSYVNNIEKNAMEAAQKRAEQTAANFQKIQQRINELNDSLNNLTSLQEGLDNLTKGTSEWAEALKQTNDEVLRLIEEYPELAKYVTTSADGAMTISQEGIDTVQREYEDKEAKNRASKILSKNRADEAELKVLRREWAETATYGSETGKFWANAGAIAASGATALGTGAAIGTAIGGPVGTLIGGLIGGIAGTLVGVVSVGVQEGVENEKKHNVENTEDFKNFAEAYSIHGSSMMASEEALRKALGNLEGPLSENTLALFNNKEATEKLIQAYNQSKNASYVERIQLGAAILGEDASALAKYIAGSQQQNIVKDPGKFWIKVKEVDRKYAEDEDKRAAEDLLKARGLKYFKVTDEGDNKVQVYWESGGEPTEYTIRDIHEMQAEDLIAEQIQKYRGAQIKQISENINKHFSEAVQNIIPEIRNGTADFSKLTLGQMSELKSGIFNESDFAYFASADGGVSAKELRDNYEETIKRRDKTLADITQKAINDPTTRADFSNLVLGANAIDTSNLSLEAYDFFAKSYSDIAIAGGQGLLEEYKEALNAAGGKSDDLINAFAAVDWTSVKDPREHAKTIVDNLGLDFTPQLQEKLGTIANIFANHIETLEESQKKYQSWQALIDKTVAGTTWSAEEYDKLEKSQQKYFTTMTDGTHILIGNARELRDELRKAQSETAYRDAVGAVGVQNKLANQIAVAKSKGEDTTALEFELSQAEGKTLDMFVQYAKTTATNENELNNIWNDEKFSDVKGKTPALKAQILEAIDIQNLANSLGAPLEETAALWSRFGGNRGVIADYYIRLTQATRELEQQKRIVQELEDSTKFLGSDTKRLNNLKAQSKALAEQAKYEKDLMDIELEGIAKDIQNNGLTSTDLNKAGISSNEYNAFINDIVQKGTFDEVFYQKLKSAAIKGGVEDFDILDEYLTQYSNKLIEGTDAVNESLYAALDKNAESFELQFTLKLDVQSTKREFAEFYKNFDSTQGVQVELFNFKSYQQDLSTLSSELNKLHQAEAISDEEWNDMSEDAKINAIEQGRIAASEKKRLIEEKTSQIMNTIKSQQEAQINAIEEMNKLYDEQVSYLETASGLIDKQLKTQELLTGKESKDINLLQQKRDIDKSIYESRKRQFADIRAQYNALDPSDRSADADAIRKAYFEAANEVADAMNSALESNAAYIEEYAKSMMEGVFGLSRSDIEMAQEEQNWIDKDANKYLDNINKAYELDKMRRTFDKAINESTSVSAQQRLAKIYNEQVKALEEKGELTKEDFERANKMLEIEQARLALENTRDSKTKMRLMRGADGTYGYQYVADQNKIDEAQQKVADLENQLYNMDKDALKESSTYFAEQWMAALDMVTKYAQGGFSEDEKGNLLNVFRVLAKDKKQVEAAMGDWLETNGLTLDKVLGFSDEEWAKQGFSKKMVSFFKSMAQGDMSAFLKLIESGTEEELQAFLETLSSLDYADIITDTQRDAANLNNPLLEGSAALAELGNLAEDNTGYFDNQTTAILRTCAALSGLSDLINGGELDASRLAGNMASLVDTVTKTIAPSSVGQLSFDTGGYTGAWGPDGRLATLHEKELVLNKYDTVNILSAVDIVRSLGDSMLKTVSGMGRGYDLPMAAWELAKDFIIEQTVHINAEFPNAADRSEIEAAFEELMLLATQHAFEDVRGR